MIPKKPQLFFFNKHFDANKMSKKLTNKKIIYFN